MIGTADSGARSGRGRALEACVLAFCFAAVLGVARRYSTDVAGGSDSYGYVSAAVRLSRGRLWEPEKVLSPFGMPEDARLTHPLGYLEHGRDGTVPAYPLGYPLLMAVPVALFGVRAAFWVTPVLAAATVLLTYALGRACAGRLAGVGAAALLAATPTFLASAFQPLSDVPATFCAALALVALVAAPGRPWADALLGAAAGLAVLVRPNMALMAAVAFAFLIARGEWRRLGRAALAAAPFLAAGALANRYLFGAAWRTGYGSVPLDLTFAGAVARAGRYLVRLNEQQAGVGLVILAAAVVFGGLALSQRLVLTGVAVAFLVFFALYPIDDAWWYFRFLLPAMPAVTAIEGGLVARLTGAGRWRWPRVALVAAGLCLVVAGSLRTAVQRWVFHVADDERRYPIAAAYVARSVGARALVVAMQHSGSLRFYAGLPTVRYDLRTLQELRSTLARAAQAGAEIYLVAEPSDLDYLRKLGRAWLLDHATLMGKTEPGAVSLYRLEPTRDAPAPAGP